MDNNKINLLWIGDSPEVSTGFGRVAQGILESLLTTGNYNISVLGINHPVGIPHRYEGMFRIYPARAKGDIYGYNMIDDIMKNERPEVVFINNDLWICQEYSKKIPAGVKIISYSPVDALPIEKDWLGPLVATNTRVTTYTEFARQAIKDAGYKKKIPIFGHGVDTDEFYPISDARNFLNGIPNDVFVIQNVGRNQPRKRIDLFLKACSIFLDSIPKKEHKDVMFYWHGSLRDIGWNLITLAQRWEIDDKLLLTDQTNFTPASGVSIQMLNKIYNVADVHVLTSMGEGWGLPNFESAACGVAQVVPNHSACKEIWKDSAKLIDIKYWEVLTGGINTEGGVIDAEHLAEILKELFYNRDEVKRLGELAYEKTQQECYSWEYIAYQVHDLIKDTLENWEATKGWKEETRVIEDKDDGVSSN